MMQLYTDTNLPLAGLYGVDDLSIVVHDMDGSRLTCANINDAVDEDMEVDDDDDDDGIGLIWLIFIVAFGFGLLYILVFCAVKYCGRSGVDAAVCGTREEKTKLKARPPSLEDFKDMEGLHGIEIVYSVPSPIHSASSMA
mmetsp:Transcript_6287/g.17606  ORF Transcript_6287/g.17606 Transcript_6287/m.17606 type:complete len:140 (-) Transcript_6287:265-684(-)